MKKTLSHIFLIVFSLFLCSCNTEKAPNKEIETPTELATVSACFYDERSSQTAPEYHEFISADSEYLSKVLFGTDKTVTDFKFFELDADAIANDGTYKIGNILCTLDELTPQKPIVIGLEFVGIFPHHAFCFTDTDGSVKYRCLLISSKDGSLIDEEFRLGEKAW